MATTLQEILERYEHEHASTHAVIAAMPDAHASFRPHERSLSWAQLAWHVATTPLYYVSEVFKLPTQSGWDLDSATNGCEAEEYWITADTGDARLDEIEREILADLAECGENPVAVCQGLDSYLRTVRDDLRRDTDDEQSA